MKLIRYLRVSTDRQATDGEGLAVRRRTSITRWARSNGHRIVGTCTDAGISGAKDLDVRLGLADALDAVRSGAAEGIVVYRLDRWARDLLLQETLLAELRRLGGRLFSESDAENELLDDNPADPTRRMVRQILGAVAEHDRAMIGLRLARARHSKAARGGYAGFGSPRYGTRAEGGELVDDLDERAAIARVLELQAEGRSLRQIADVLDAEGHRAKRGGSWHPNAVRRVLDRHGRAA